MYQYKIELDDKFSVLNIGTCGENNATLFCFNVQKWKTQFGANGKFELLLEKPKTKEIEKIEVQDNDNYVNWIVNSKILTVPGKAKVQLIYRIDEKVIKSRIFIANIKKGID